MSNADNFMARCSELAQQARDQGDAAVGSVIVRHGEVVGEGCEQVQSLRDATGHAELVAIRAACERLDTLDLSDCALYTNVEPCWMCCYAIRELRIKAVIIGIPVANIGGVTSAFPVLATTNVPDWELPPEVIWHERR